MKALQMLPEGYGEIFNVNLQKDKKTALKINIAALVIAAIMAVAGAFLVPIKVLFDTSAGLGIYCLRFGIMIASLVFYVVMHEAVHGVAMKMFGTKNVKFGFTGLYAFAGSDEYYSKKSYIVIALAPVIVWGAVLAAVNVFVPASWFWVVYFIQISNISGAAGDIYVTAKFCRMPKDILVRDSGVGMTVYSKEIG